MGLTPAKSNANAKALFSRINAGVNQAVALGLQRVGNRIVVEATKNLLRKRPYAAKASGDLLAKFFVRLNTRNLTVTVGNTAPHANFVEWGRAPGKKAPPPNDIKDWLISKGMSSDPRTVFLMGRKISRYGIKPYPFMRQAINTVEAEVPKIINQAVDEYLAKEGVTRT